MAFINGKWRQSIHLEAPHGWINDPNGLCYFGGYYHVYFQYSPDSADGGGRKCWGHYRSKDLTEWEFTGTVLFPDTPDDKDGVYSGCAIVDNDTLHIFYTGNVKEDGEHDYITSGRGANVIHVTTKDGINMSRKTVLLRNSDYPDFCSCHVRDPKVRRENGQWKMVLGARTLDNKGCILLYSSGDLVNWKYDGSESIPDFGYMWECPDIFSVGGHRYLSISPQGLEHEDFRFQNVYQSGYFKYENELKGFQEWDYGFDFYAPQTFEAPDGRRIIIGWQGIGDIPYINPTVSLGYQHCLTVPRELTADDNGNLLQNPIRELAKLRKEKITLEDNETANVKLPSEINADVRGKFSVSFGNFAELRWDGSVFELKFSDEKVSGGRKARKTLLPECSDIRILADKSSLEIYLDGGKKVLSSRMYPGTEAINISVQGIKADIFSLSPMKIKYSE